MATDAESTLSLNSDQHYLPSRVNQKSNLAIFLQDLIREFRDCYRYRYVCYSYVQNNLRLRYRRSFFGVFCAILTPLTSYAVMGLVFAVNMKITVPNFLIYFFTGSVFFNFISVGLNRAPLAMLENENYIRKIYVPKLNFVLNGVLLEAANFLLGFFALVVLGMAFGKIEPHWSMFFLPIPVFFAFIMLVGATCLLSVTTVFFRDLRNVIPLFVQCLFFLTPVFYTIEAIPEKYRWLVRFNPFYHLVESFRIPVVDAVFPPIIHIYYMVGFSLTLLVIGLAVLKKYENRIVFKL